MALRIVEDGLQLARKKDSDAYWALVEEQLRTF